VGISGVRNEDKANICGFKKVPLTLQLSPVQCHVIVSTGYINKSLEYPVVKNTA
jgi:hypothetical protein